LARLFRKCLADRRGLKSNGYRASCPRIGRGLNTDADWRWTLCDCGLIAGADNSRLRLWSWAGHDHGLTAGGTRTQTGCGLDAATVTARMRTGCGQDDNADIGVDFARLVPGQRADIARTQKPHFDEE